MYAIEVGKKFDGNYREEGIRLEYNGCGFNLNLFFADITAEEIKDVREGRYTFGLTLIEGILFFTCKFGKSIETSDVPFHFGLYKDDRVDELPEEILDGEGLALNIVAVDSRTGIVKAIRVIGLSNDFSKILLNTCLTQNLLGIDSVAKFDKRLASIQEFYSSQEIYNKAIVTCCSK